MMATDYVDKYNGIKSNLDVCFKLIDKGAAVLKGCRESSMFFVNNCELPELIFELRLAKLDIYVLYRDRNRSLVFIYRQQELARHLSCRETRNYLRHCGYEGDLLFGYLPRLRKRVSKYYRGEMEFPHEVGVFLTYPICDVEGFVKYQGRQCLFSGYWKIYDNLSQTLSRFADFDRARKEAMEEWLEGKSLCEIVS